MSQHTLISLAASIVPEEHLLNVIEQSVESYKANKTERNKTFMLFNMQVLLLKDLKERNGDKVVEEEIEKLQQASKFFNLDEN
jgi:hypothetical protein